MTDNKPERDSERTDDVSACISKVEKILKRGKIVELPTKELIPDTVVHWLESNQEGLYHSRYIMRYNSKTNEFEEYVQFELKR